MNSPVPPNTTFLKPGTVCTSYSTEGAKATTLPELTRKLSPSSSSRRISGPLIKTRRGIGVGRRKQKWTQRLLRGMFSLPYPSHTRKGFFMNKKMGGRRRGHEVPE